MYRNYSDIKKEYENIRFKNLLKYDELKNKIYAENPVLKDLDSKIVKAYLDIGRNKLENKSVEELEKELNELNILRSNYMKEHNISSDYREISYDCEKCKDTGYVEGKKCSCFVQKEIELFDNISHFKNYIKEDNFNNLNPSYYVQSGFEINGMSYSNYMKNTVFNLKSGIQNMDSIPYNIMLIGPTGTGKTFLSRCAGSYAIELNKSVLYVNVNEYINSLKPDYDGVPLKSYAIEADLFILDDLGTEKISEFSNVELNYIIDKRLNDKKSTIITTNFVLNQIKENYLSPMYSRVSHSYLQCYLGGEDLRRVKNANI